MLGWTEVAGRSAAGHEIRVVRNSLIGSLAGLRRPRAWPWDERHRVTHLVLIPSYNTGPILRATVQGACAAWQPVWVVVDGSTDGSDRVLDGAGRPDRVLRLAANGGKGAAVLHGLRAAEAAGFTHALVMDADGQHCAADIARFMAASRAQPDAMILGQPVFGPDAPRARVLGRRVSNALTRLAAPACVADGLFGFRVYPVAPLRQVMERTRFMRRFDFDPEAVVRLAWHGCTAVNLPTRVRYPSRAAGGVSHFHYGRDNVRLALMHARLLAGAVMKQPALKQM